MAERLGIGLQNQVQQFDSAWHLTSKKNDSEKSRSFFIKYSVSLPIQKKRE